MPPELKDQETVETELDEKEPETEQDDEGEEEVTEEETTEETTEEEGDDKKDDDAKADTKAEKRINQLVAKLKSEEEKNKDLRAQLAEKDEELQEEIRIFKAAQAKKNIPTWGPDKRPVTELTDTEYRQFIRDLYSVEDWDKSQKDAVMDAAEQARERFADESKELAQEVTDLRRQELEQWVKEWSLVKEEILAMNPELAKHVDAIDKEMTDEMKRRPFLETKLKRGPLEKFKYTLKVMERMGIEHDLEEDAPIKEMPSIGKGSATSSKKSVQFTAAQIKGMSLEEFEANEAAIKKQFANKKKKK